MVKTASLDELLKSVEAAHSDGWGRWRLGARARLLCLEGDDDDPYCIRVEELLRDQELLYIMLQLSRHVWMDDASLGALIRASDNIRCVCGWAN